MMFSRRMLVGLSLLVAVCGAGLFVWGATWRHDPAAAPLPAAAGHPFDAPLPGRLLGAGLSGPGRGPGHGGPRPVPQAGMTADEIRIPSQHVTAAIGTATLDSAGVLTPPRDPGVVGRWAGSAALDAATGEVTLAGHVNWSGMPPFAFGRLAYLTPGDLIYTTDQHGRQTAWRVNRVYALPKTLPIDAAAFAGPAGPRTLALITCGGPFDAQALSYDDNIYVYATPASSQFGRQAR